MKKLISILAIMMVLVGVVFAETNEKLVVNAKVAEIKPEFDIYGKLTADGETDNTEKIGLATAAGQTLTSKVDPSSGAISVLVRLNQNIESKYTGSFSLTVEATRLNCVEENLTQYHTKAPAVSGQISANKEVKGSADGQKSTTGLTVTTPTLTNSGEDAASATVVYPLAYTGIKIAANDIDTFTLTWAKNEALPAGSYQASITLTYTVN